MLATLDSPSLSAISLGLFQHLVKVKKKLTHEGKLSRDLDRDLTPPEHVTKKNANAVSKKIDTLVGVVTNELKVRSDGMRVVVDSKALKATARQIVEQRLVTLHKAQVRVSVLALASRALDEARRLLHGLMTALEPPAVDE